MKDVKDGKAQGITESLDQQDLIQEEEDVAPQVFSQPVAHASSMALNQSAIDSVAQAAQSVTINSLSEDTNTLNNDHSHSHSERQDKHTIQSHSQDHKDEDEDEAMDKADSEDLQQLPE